MRIALFIFLFLISTAAFLTGFSMMQEPSGVSIGLTKDMLSTTPFEDYFFPGVLMILLIGLPSIMSILLLFNQPARGIHMSFAISILTSLWIIMQLILIQTYIGISVFFLIISIISALLSVQLRGKLAL